MKEEELEKEVIDNRKKDSDINVVKFVENWEDKIRKNDNILRKSDNSRTESEKVQFGRKIERVGKEKKEIEVEETSMRPLNLTIISQSTDFNSKETKKVNLLPEKITEKGRGESHLNSVKKKRKEVLKKENFKTKFQNIKDFFNQEPTGGNNTVRGANSRTFKIPSKLKVSDASSLKPKKKKNIQTKYQRKKTNL